MLCPTCGTENRPGARFCAKCGTPLRSDPPRPPSRPEPAASDPAQVAGKVGLFGGHGLLTLGALLVLLAFMLPWASCSGIQLSGLDIVTQSSQYGGSGSEKLLVLVPLGALALLAIGITGVIVNLLGTKLPLNLAHLIPFLPLVAALPGLCGCCPSCAFFVNVQNARSDPNNWGLGTFIQVRYGFWLTLIGLGVSLVGMVAALVGGLVAQRHPPQIESGETNTG